MMIVTDWRLAIAAFAVIPLVYLTSHLFQKRVRVAYRDIRARLARINASLQERITGMRVVQLFGREADEAKRFGGLNRGHLDANLKSITIYALYFPAIEFLTSLALAILLVAGAHRVGAGTLSVGVVAAFLQLLRRFGQGDAVGAAAGRQRGRGGDDPGRARGLHALVPIRTVRSAPLRG